jgi:glutaredoxin-like protein NrdH
MSKVIVYSKAGCGQCTFTKKELEKLGLEYEERHIDLNDEYREEAVNQGAMEAPFVVPPVGEPFSGFRPDLIAKLAV